MTWLDYLQLYAVFHLPVLHLPLLAICYALWIQHERGGWCKVFHVFGILGFLPDVIANHTTFAFLFWRRPSPGKWTFSQQLGVLILDTGWRGVRARSVAAVLNWFPPSGNPHIHS